MSALEVLDTIGKGSKLPKMEEICTVRPESHSNEHEMENLDVRDSWEDDSRPEDMCTHPSMTSDVHVEASTEFPSVRKTKIPSRTMKPPSRPPIHRTVPSLLIGDLVWARVSPKAQWWPGMIAYDPRLVQYFRLRAKDGRLEYHIQWFGKGAHRSWISVALMDPMVGADQHPLLQKTGGVALKELKEALSLSRRERRVCLTFNYGGKRPLPAVGGGKKARKGKECHRVTKGGSVEPISVGITSTAHAMKGASSEDKPTSMSEDTPTAVMEDTPTTSVDTPTTSGDTPTTSEDAPTTSEDTPTTSEDTPTTSEDTPTTSEDAPSTLEDTPAASEDTPTTSEDTPTPTAISKDTPTTLEDTPTPTAMSEDTPTPTAMSEDTPTPTAMSKDTPTTSEDTPTAAAPTWTAVRCERLMATTPSESPSPPLPEEPVCSIPHHLPTPPNSSPSVSPHPSEADPPTQTWPPDCRKRPSSTNSDDTQDQKKKCVSRGEIPVAATELQSNISTSEKEAPSINMEVESISSEQPPPVDPPVTLEEGQCSICFEDSRYIISCSKCGSQFDCGCLGITHLPSPPYVCCECLIAATQCFFCKSVEGDLITCSHRTCLRRYHKACVQGREGFVFHKNGAIVCPVHACIRCQLTPEENRRAPRAPLTSCTQCLLTLHSHPSCLVAGCEPTSPHSMVCYQHLQKRRQVVTSSGRGIKMPAHINLDWCYTCGEGGLLLCCDLCATAYHAACVGEEGCGEAERWVCPDCQRHNVLTYGGLAWCKCGVHQWWPCEVLPHKQVPDHLLRVKPVECMFMVRFFGTGEHWWTHHGRCVKYHLPDQVSGSTGERKDDFAAKAGSKTQALLKKALQEVAERAMLVSHQEKTSKKYIYLKSNKYLVHFPSPSDGMHLEMCQCSEEYPCDDESRCVNRASKIECSKQTCKLGDSCRNRRLRNADYAPCVPFYTGNRGWGLKTTRPVAAGQFVVEYVGEVIDEGMCRERLQRYHEEGKQSFYILSLVKGLYIDAAAKANKARFINHSCQPNLETQKWMVDGKTRIGLFSLTDIPAGTELTFDYQLDSLGHSKMACRCGAPNCSGLLGEKARSLLTAKTKNTSKKKRKQRRRKASSTAVE